ncbi:ATPase (plasmid) [Clostridium tyrobutyricum]|uniref:ParM/StbA family protein n=1 Tax=Clostridium tyrobutyricum TaxID=1519 RepID=UPI0039F7291F
MVNLGVDLGNGYVKFRGKKFASRIKLGRVANFGKKREDIYQVNYNGIDYVVGDGEYFTTGNRYFTDDYKISLLTSVALSSKDPVIDVNICVGLPIIKYMSEVKDKFEKYLNNLNVEKIKVNNEEKIINIKSAVVFVEGALVVLTKDNQSILTIDIGAGTVNIIQWENQEPVKFDTKDKSFYNLYSKIAKHLRDTGRGSVSSEYIEKHLGEDEIIINQKKVDIRDTHKIIEKHVTELASEIESYFDISNVSKIKLMGGGALPTFKYWKEIYNDGVELVDDSQFINSKIYDKVLEMSAVADEK